MRKLLFAAVIVATMTAFGCSKDDKTATDKPKHDDVPMVTLDEVEKGIAANELTAVDCNGDDLRKKLGVVPGAILISDEEAFASSELPADKARKLVFYCSGPS